MVSDGPAKVWSRPKKFVNGSHAFRRSHLVIARDYLAHHCIYPARHPKSDAGRFAVDFDRARHPAGCNGASAIRSIEPSRRLRHSRRVEARMEDAAMLKSWKKPRVVEVAVGLEINSYACPEL
jgi:coenzyme PQQ precursor peptide PqqA